MTPARIALGRTGDSIATSDLLDFQLAHARARDAIHLSLQPASLLAAMRSIPAIAALPDPGVLALHSAAADREKYLQRPDLGRKLDRASLERLQQLPQPTRSYGLSIVLADGLSALAIERHAIPVLNELLALLTQIIPELSLAPVCIVEQGRVAIGDEIGRALGAELAVILIGERPGLSSPDSLGAYITWLSHADDALEDICASRRITDADRNCISNIRNEGLSYAQAASRLLHYIREARSRQLTGVALKDPAPAPSELAQEASRAVRKENSENVEVQS